MPYWNGTINLASRGEASGKECMAAISMVDKTLSQFVASATFSVAPAGRVSRELIQNCILGNLAENPVAVLEGLIRQYAGQPLLLNSLANTLFELRRFHLARKAYTLALKKSPGNAASLQGLGICCMVEGAFPEALKYYRKSLLSDPYNVRLIFNYLLIESPDQTIIDHLHTIYSSEACKGADRVYACFALAKLYEFQREIPKAFRYFEEGNDLQLTLSHYDEKRHFATLSEIERVFDGALFDKLLNTQRYEISPVFILGMPRSGTTLVEQILASHPSVFGAGEADIMSTVASTLVPQMIQQPFPQGVSGLTADAVHQMAGYYLNHLSSFCSNGRRIVVDKTPNNFFLIGLIHILFPHAPIIHCVRDPMDNCWSLFRQLFVGSVPYCYNQVTLGRYYRRYQQTMRHWHHVLPGRILDVSYENLVENPETVIGGLLSYCQLPWEEQCMKFYRTRRTVATASASQVRRPLYADSLNAWQPVAAELAPLRAVLASAHI